MSIGLFGLAGAFTALADNKGEAAPPAELPTCGEAVATTAVATDANLRDSAQRGLDFLKTSTVQWQGSHQCYGCHVQAVTLKAMAVGRNHDYEVDSAAIRTVIGGMTTATGGSRSAGGLRYANGVYLSASKTLGGSAFARFDQWVGTDLRDDLMQTASELLEMQQGTGAIRNDYTSAPVAIGALQDTVLAMVTWNQAHARSADDRWLTAVARSEDWLHGQIAAWGDKPPAKLQEINYALMGLQAASSGASEDHAARLVRWLLERQGSDGGWALDAGGVSDAYATGQTLYALRLMGFTETDPVVSRGTAWLVEHQGKDGGWSKRGRERAEAMWAVIGLVSVDVLTLQVTGIADGEHVDGIEQIAAEAHDNQGGGVVDVELRIDDVPLHRACGSELAHGWNTAGLEPGPHIVDLVARNSAGKTARRRLTVYAGDHWMTRVGTSFDDGGTVVSVRNLAPSERKDRLRLTVLEAVERDGVEKPGKAVHTSERDGTQGSMRFFWDGKTEGGTQLRGRHFARLEYLDRAGTVRQTEEVLFVHEPPEVQAAQYAEIGGQLRLDGASGANSVVELVDKAGNVLRSAVTTSEGQYRFKGVKKGKYSVRVQKDGWGEKEVDVDAAPAAAEEQVDLDL